VKHFIDFETTGFDPWKNCAVSLAWIIADDDYQPIAKFYEECCPNVLNWTIWTKEAQRVHGFTPEYISKQQSETALCEKLLAFLEENNDGTLGNLYYHADSHIDHKFLMGILLKNLDGRYYEIYKFIRATGHRNTMSDFRNHLGSKLYGLSKLAKHYDEPLEHHNALSDTTCLLNCYRKMEYEKKGYLIKEGVNENLEENIKIAEETIKEKITENK